jgi:hypothetical protein
MNQTIRQMRIVQDALRQRVTLATAEFYAKTSITAEALSPRFNVVPHGNNLFGVVDSQTGVERAEVVGHNNACQAAQSFENVADFTQTAQVTVGNFARLMLRWTAALTAILACFVALGNVS